MAQLTEILTREKQRTTEESLRVIYLYQEGSFLKADEWSAWLCHSFSFAILRLQIIAKFENMHWI